jgi:pantetheine-phosphate adenylyltransferase
VTRVAIYPGSFDPITNGHVDLARRSARLFDRLIVAVYDGGQLAVKRGLFDADERVGLARECLAELDNVVVDTFGELLVDYARRVGAQTIVRGLRAVSDFEDEFKLAHMYRHLAPELEVVFLMTSPSNSFISSSSIREVASLGGAVAGLVPPQVVAALEAKYEARQADPAGTGALRPAHGGI